MLKLRKKFTNSSLTGWKKDPVDWIMVLEKIRTQLDGMGYVISDKDFMIHTLANLPEEYKSKVKSLESDLDNKDGPLTLDHMLVELDAKYKKICKKNNYDPENEDKGRRRNNNNVKNGTIKFFFVWSKENDADIFTKNTSESTFNKHTEKFMIQNST